MGWALPSTSSRFSRYHLLSMSFTSMQRAGATCGMFFLGFYVPHVVPPP